MNKGDLVRDIEEKTGVTQADADNVISTMFDIVESQVSKGGEVSIPGYIKFERKNTKARKRRNPATGAEMDIPAGTAVKVTAGSKLKKAGKGR